MTTRSCATRKAASSSSRTSCIALNHQGENFSVRGPLNVPRTPQGRPVIVQAGGSEDMIAVAAEFAEVIFCAPLTLEAAQKFYRDLKGRVASYGRDPDQMKIMPGLTAVIGRTEAEAQEQYEYLQSLIHPIVAREILSMVLGSVDLSPYPLDGPLPENLPLSNASQSTFQYVNDMARKEKLTMRQVAMRVAGARGKAVVARLAHSRSPIRWKSGSARTAATASTSCRRSCPAGSMTSSNWCCRSCNGAACSARNTKAARCASISASHVP